MELQKTSPYRFLAYISSIVMIIGANLPQYFEKSDSALKNIYNVDNEGVLLYISALIVIMMRYCKRKKYILAPAIFQIGMIVYYIVVFTKNSKFEMIHIGFILEVAAVVFLLISLFVNIDVKKDVVHDMCTLNIKPLEDDEYVDNIISKDLLWISLMVAITIIMVVFKVKIL